ncbi:Phosphate regulon transcriptional regulatory protein PhoB (SphR) [Labilithrix luteola]|uniref:Phosphate regulon transcriptional regulatory protein PhoB (SphR) n=1 Tax=Labilithrix luteola TaxID=1391654 RepID=A0A0K1QEI5_9BACT|nr:Phosphate regulon transcriptional regulatory protein PhoB (SphR) [Labilithrix luteola]
MARASQPDAIVLDAALPDASGIEVCTVLRKDPSTRRSFLVVASTNADEDDRVAAFEAGADDWIRKPFSTRELLLRVRAILRRRGRRLPEDTLSLGPLRIERAARRVTVSEERIELTRREFDLLLRLADGRGRVQTRESLVAELWPDEAPSLRVVDTTVKRLRRKMGPSGAWIRTLRGIGYQLTSEG